VTYPGPNTYPGSATYPGSQAAGSVLVDTPTGVEQGTPVDVVVDPAPEQAATPAKVFRPTASSAIPPTPVRGPQHLTVPMTLSATGSYGCVDQDSPADVTSCVQVLLRTRVGERLEVPQFGVPDPTFMAAGQGWAGVLEQAVQRWEPRAAGAAIPIVINADGTATVQVGVPTTPGGPAA